MTIKLHNPAPNPENRETSICEIELDVNAYFSHTSNSKSPCEKSSADCIIVRRGSTTSECWPKSVILNWEEL